jgi:heterodisulfide reductase subunit A
MLEDKTVLVIGGGIAGLSAAAKLAANHIRSVLVEKSPSLGGHAVQYACKATDACVKCGACVVEEKWRQVQRDPRIEVAAASRVTHVTPNDTGGWQVVVEKIDDGEAPQTFTCRADAVILATGFKPFDPVNKPYGYGRFPDVITNLELERMLREKSLPVRLSDNRPPEKVAFVQCVGSRDAKLGHLWCSKVCCASALRMARLIKFRRPETDISVFYIDIQTFGKEFESYYRLVKKELQMIRAIPADIFQTAEDRLRVVYFNFDDNESREALFDMVVLAVGITPATDSRSLAELFQVTPADSGFLENAETSGVFTAGAAGGPMSIAESVASAGRAVRQVTGYLSRKLTEHQ